MILSLIRMRIRMVHEIVFLRTT